ncbi:hypothetical protein GTQ99_24095, partial [Kineococcus sp. T13]|uniref:hypothetical protein n=1 Tax=Kineococcus vitellinus TaxID=2696565 RepID=UPI0014123E0B|nr:hypothetical protein [Kineococcus vitellinus]
PVAGAFGHGLSYTTFEHSGLRLVAGEDGLEVRVDVRNSGDVAAVADVHADLQAVLTGHQAQPGVLERRVRQPVAEGAGDR